MPTFSSYTKRDGSVEPSYNLSIYDSTNNNANGAKGYKEFVLKVRNEQPMLYNTLIDANGLTSANITNDTALTSYITKNTINVMDATSTPIALSNDFNTKAKKGIFNKSK